MKVSLEFAHSSLAAVDQKDIARSVETAQTVAGWLDDQGHDFSTVVLLDDKKVSPAEAKVQGEKLVGMVRDLGLPADKWIFETSLRRWLPNLKQLLSPAQAKKLRAADKYFGKYGCLPCSVDIALWHALRLGCFGPQESIEAADIAISILGDGNIEFEDLARQNFLDHIEGGKIASRIVTVFYPDSPTAAFNTDQMLDQVAIAIKEAQTCPEF